MSLTFSNSQIRRIGILTTTSAIATIGLVYLCWKLFYRRGQTDHSDQANNKRRPLTRAPSFEEWENAIDTPTKESLPTPQQLYQYGIEHLNLSIDFWQRALNMVELSLNHSTDDQINQKALIELREKLQFLLNKIDVFSTSHELSNVLRETRESLSNTEYYSPTASSIEHHLTTDFQQSTRIQQEMRTAMSVQSDLTTFNDRRSLRSIRSMDSFQSCPDDAEWIDSADLIFDPSSPYYSLPAFYVYGLRLAEKNQVPYRKLRTKLLRCSSDTDYLAKLYCIRSACDEVLGTEEKKEFLKRISRAICEKFLEKASKDKIRFIHAFEHMNNILADENGWSMINEELTAAGIKHPTVYNVGIDFMLLEGFEILDSPPSAMRTILQNTWLSEAFREQALNKAVSYALKVRRATAKYQDGFLTTFLSLIEDMTPVFAWGILGPDSAVKPICTFLKDCVLEFARSIYDLTSTDYSSLTALTQDVDRKMNNLLERIVTEFDIDQNILSHSSSTAAVRFT